jgi:RHS repeat-associated protein
MLMMRRRLIMAPRVSLIAFLVVAFASVYLRLTWVSKVPPKPAWMPSSSVWISGPHTALEFTRIGEWVGCSTISKGAARCWFTDYKGAVLFEGEFIPVTGGGLQRLQIKQGELPDFRFFAKERNTGIRIIRLDDGTILAPVEDAAEFKSIQDHISAQQMQASLSTARYREPGTGRFLSPDPSVLDRADPTNPQSLNLYTYALNNPLRYTDPTELESACHWGGNDWDDTPGNGGAGQGECEQQGGGWDEVPGPETTVTVNGTTGDSSISVETWQPNPGDVIPYVSTGCSAVPTQTAQGSLQQNIKNAQAMKPAMPWSMSNFYSNVRNGGPQDYKQNKQMADVVAAVSSGDAVYSGTRTGRFLSPDPGWFFASRLENPQTWNLYSYALNNPLKNTDPDGYDCVYLNNAGNGVESVDQQSDSGECGTNGGYWVDGTATRVTLFTQFK